MAGLKLDHLYKSYQDIQAIQDVTLDTHEKAFIVLAGPSGCGKTTLLHMIAGFLKCDQGKIYLNQERIDEVEPDKRGIAMVFQDAALFPHLSVHENIAFGLSLAGVQEEDIQEQVEKVAKLVGVDSLLNRKARTLSNGQKQRVSIARALVRRPKLFLMDEPLSALDARLKSQLRIEISMLYQQMDATFLYVTHDQIEAMTLANLLIIMKDGMIQQVGKPMDVYQNPDNLFTAVFLGNFEINQFHGYIKEQQLYFEEHRLALKNQINDREIILALRPEHIQIDDLYGYEGKIMLIENLGDNVFYHIGWKEHIVLMKGSLNGKYQINDPIKFNFHFHDALCFDRVTEERLRIL